MHMWWLIMIVFSNDVQGGVSIQNIAGFQNFEDCEKIALHNSNRFGLKKLQDKMMKYPEIRYIINYECVKRYD